MHRRQFVLLLPFAVVYAPRFIIGAMSALMSVFLVGCGRDPRKPSSGGSVVQIPAPASVHDALQNKAPISTRPTSFGAEIISFDGITATKGTKTDDGFVILVNGISLPVEARQHPLHGTNTIEVRFVPNRVKGEDAKPVPNGVFTAQVV